MTDFSHVAAKERRIATAEFPIEGLEGMRPVLICRPASEDNPGYFNALLKRQRRNRGRRGRNITVKDIKRLREDDIELLPEHCVTGWVEGSVIDGNGEPVPYDTETCRKLFEALVAAPGGRDIFDDFRNEVADPSSFVEYGDDEDVSEQAGN